MKIFSKILCPVDFSEFSSLALHYAAALAKDQKSELTVLHVVAPPIPAGQFPDVVATVRYEIGDMEENVRGFVSRYVPSDVSTSIETQIGSPASLIADAMQEDSFDLIVMGTHGLSGYENLLVGSVAGKVLHKSDVPVLTICRPKHQFLTDDPENPVRLKRILCAIAPEVKAVGLVKTALSIANAFEARILFYQLKSQKDLEEEMEFDLKEVRELIPQDNTCDLRYVVETGDPAKMIVRAAEEFESDLVLVGHHTRKLRALEVLGSVAISIIRESPCPVMVVRD